MNHAAAELDGAFEFRPRQVAWAIQLACALNLGAIALPAVASCPNGGPTTVTSSETCNLTQNQYSQGAVSNFGLITISNSISVRFDDLNNAGTVSNSGDLHNGLSLNNSGTLNNSGALLNFNLYGGPVLLTNSGTIENTGLLINANQNEINRPGTLANKHLLYNAGTIQNKLTGTLTSSFLLVNRASGILFNDGLLDVISGILLNLGEIRNYADPRAEQLRLPPGYAVTVRNQAALNNGGTFWNGGSLTNEGALNNGAQVLASDGQTLNSYQGTFNNTGSLTNNGTLTNQTGGTFDNKGTLTNTGTLTNQAGGTFHNEAGGTLTNQATMNNAGNLVLYAGSTLNNIGGVLNNQAGGRIDSMVSLEFGSAAAGTIKLLAGGQFVNLATLTNGAGHTQDNAGGLFNLGTFANAGTVGNSGTLNNLGTLQLVQGSTLDNKAAGTLSSVGTLDNRGTLNNDGTLTNDVSSGGFFGTLHGTLSNDGTLNNAGTLNNQTGTTFINNATGVVLNKAALNNRGVFENRTFAKLNLAQGSTLDNAASGALSNLGLIDNHGAFDNSGTVVNEILDRGMLGLLQGMLTNSGTLTNKSTGVLKNYGMVSNTGVVSNSGAMWNAGNIVSDGSLMNTGTFTVTATGTVSGTGSFAQTAGVTQVDGALSQTAIAVSGGVLKGKGTVTGAVELSGTGHLQPGDSPGTLTIRGAFLMSGGTLDIEIDGQAPGEFDVLNIEGGASFLGGEIVFDFTHYTQPLPTTLSFQFLETGGGVTNLDALTFGFLGLVPDFTFAVSTRGTIALENLHSSMTLPPRPSSVPLPPALWLLGAPLVGLMSGRRRWRAV